MRPVFARTAGPVRPGPIQCRLPASLLPCPQVSVTHGGTGMILLVVLIRAIRYRTLLQCLLDLANSTCGDHMVSECLWRRDGTCTTRTT